jgi:hypothetical protein
MQCHHSWNPHRKRIIITQQLLDSASMSSPGTGDPWREICLVEVRNYALGVRGMSLARNVSNGAYRTQDT